MSNSTIRGHEQVNQEFAVHQVLKEEKCFIPIEYPTPYFWYDDGTNSIKHSVLKTHIGP